MIKLEIEDYCNECNHFEANVTSPDVFEDFFGNRVCTSSDYVIRCQNRDVCKDLLNRCKKSNV